MSHVIILSRFEPLPTGHGGNHRSYQIQWDCVNALGPLNVTTVPASLWQARACASMGRVAMLEWKWMRRLRQLYRNPAKVLVRESSCIGRHNIPGLLEYYKQLVNTVQQPAVCIMEDVGFSDFIPVNVKHGIPTVACPQNIESLDAGSLKTNSRLYNLVRLMDFADEFAVLSQCAERVFISKVEAGMIGGLGLTARYYPYRPVGDIARKLQVIRANRKRNRAVAGLFLMVGTARHKSTGASFQWFIDNALHHGLPEGVKVIVAGKRTDELGVTDYCQAKALEFRGWIEQDELDALLSRVQGVLIPHLYGFGAATRLPELASAGMPVIVSQHPTMAIDPVPGMVVVEDDWDAWYEAIHKLSKSGCEAYLFETTSASSSGEKNTLVDVLRRLLD
jgi:hypothetical protein